MRSLHKW